MNRVAKSFETLTRTGQARLIILIATAWVAVWGSIWGYSYFRTISMDRWISAELDVRDNLIFELAALDRSNPNPSKRMEALRATYDLESQLLPVAYGIKEQLDRREVTARWANRALWVGPLGLVVILFSGVGGVWVYRGFKKPLADDR